MDAERRARALEGRDDVAARADEVAASRSAAITGAHELADRLRPSGGIARELRERPLRAIGLLALAGLAGLRWFAGVRRKESSEPRGAGRAGAESAGGGRHSDRRRGVAAAFVSGIAGAAAERGGRAVVDALFDDRREERREERGLRGEVDGSTADADDASGRVAKR